MTSAPARRRPSLTDLTTQTVSKMALEYEVASRAAAEERVALKRARKRARVAAEAQGHVQVVAQAVQQRAHDQIATVVTRCLEAVFDEPYSFRIHFERKRGRTEARLAFVRVRNGHEVEVDPCDGAGGGVVDVAAFALRVACLMLQRPVRRRVLVLDEPFKWVSERGEYRQRVRDLLLTLSREMKIQMIMVTHDPVLQVGKVVEL